MSFLDTIKRLTDAGERRAAQIRELRQKRADLEGEYLAAIADDDDTAAGKVRIKIAKLDEEIREKQAAIEAASALQANARRDADAEALAALREAHDKDVQALAARAIHFDELVNDKVAPLWREVEELFHKARASGARAGVDFLDVHGAKPHQIWRRVWMRFTQLAGRSFGDVAGARTSQTIESVADMFRVKEN